MTRAAAEQGPSLVNGARPASAATGMSWGQFGIEGHKRFSGGAGVQASKWNGAGVQKPEQMWRK